MALPNTQAYYDTATFVAVTIFIVQAPEQASDNKILAMTIFCNYSTIS
jgi:hypothetical protein